MQLQVDRSGYTKVLNLSRSLEIRWWIDFLAGCPCGRNDLSWTRHPLVRDDSF